MAWIEGPLQYLQTLNGTHDADLVLIVDPSSVWFQLPPAILIDRYHEIAKQSAPGSRSLRGSFKTARVQSILFGAQKRCWFADGFDDDCRDVPNSTLAEKVFGPDTDKVLRHGESNRFQYSRPRWLNPAFMLGPARELRLFFDRAQELFDLHKHHPRDPRAIFGQIFADQYRSATASPKHSSAGKILRGSSSAYAVHLDYASKLLFTEPFSPFSAAFLTSSDPTSLTTATKANSIPNPRSTLLDLDSDIAALRNAPFSILDPTTSSSSESTPQPPPPPQSQWYTSPTETNWSSVPLLTNLYTSITPALIQQTYHNQNAGKEGNRADPWKQMWFYPVARSLLAARLAAPESHVHIDGPGREWWNAVGTTEISREGFGIPVDDGEGEGYSWRGWGDLCGEEEQEIIFGDGKGMYE